MDSKRKKTSWVGLWSGDLGRGLARKGPRTSFTLLGLHASHYTGTCVVHELDMCHVCSLSESLIREGPARPEEGPDSTSFTLMGLHASSYTGKCMLLDICHVYSVSESPFRKGPARPEEEPDSTVTISQEIATTSQH